MTSKAQLQRIQEMCDIIYRDMDKAIHDADAQGFSPGSQAIVLAHIAAGVSGLSQAVKLMAGGVVS